MVAEGNGNSELEGEAFRKLFIGGLASVTTDDSLRTFYEQFGEITDCIVMKDPTTQRSRGFGFVTFATMAQVDAAQAARPHEIDGKKVDAKRAVPKDANDKGASQVSTMRLYVSGIKEAHTEAALKEYFAQYGNVQKVDIAKDKATDSIRGFAFIHFDDYDAVDKCVLLKSHTVQDMRCDVKKGLSKDEMAKFDQGSRDRQFRGDRTGRGGFGGPGGPRGGGPGGFRGGRGGGPRGGGAGGYGGGPQNAWANQGWGGPQQGGGAGGGWGGAPQQGGWGGPPQQGGWGAPQQPQQGGWGQQPQGGVGGGQGGGAPQQGGWGAPQGGGQQGGGWGQQAAGQGGWGRGY
ncbi:unnamed protein product, partial [Mesorhabditis spiculigera]